MWRPIESTIAAPETPAELATYALATAREKALTATDDRLLNLAAAQIEVERWCGRLLWRGDGLAERAVTSVVEVENAAEPVPVVPSRPVTAGATIRVRSVEKWTDGPGYADVGYVLRPGGLLRLRDIGTIQIVVDVTPPEPVPALAAEGCARLWAFRELRRPTGGGEEGGGSDRLSNAMYLSGASAVLRSLKQTGRA